MPGPPEAAADPVGVALYRAVGYTEIEAWNDEPYADHWFE